jgi:hypothetical protein
MMDAQLASFATVRELEYLEALEKHGSVIRAAKALGVVRGSIQGAMANLRKRAALRGYAPECDMTKTVPDGFKVKGVSTFYGEDGKPKGQWVKSSADDERRQEMIRAAFEAMAQDLPRLGASLPIPGCDDRLATVYTLTDSHVGMLAWAREAGADWDLAIAERTLSACFARMVESSPAARVGFVNQLGDFLHSDGLLPVTPTSGHILDQDGRYTKLVETAVRILRRVVDLALTKHERVVVLMAEGNHDMASSVWLRVMFAALYENEPRVEVIDSPLPFYVWQHGKTMLAFHHGHLKKNDQLPILFASQFPKVWGETVKRYAHTGHRHHSEEKEHSGITVIQHPTLAARDAYAARGGWIAERQVTAITYHAEYGQVARVTVTPEMVQ